MCGLYTKTHFKFTLAPFVTYMKSTHSEQEHIEPQSGKGACNCRLDKFSEKLFPALSVDMLHYIRLKEVAVV